MASPDSIFKQFFDLNSKDRATRGASACAARATSTNLQSSFVNIQSRHVRVGLKFTGNQNLFEQARIYLSGNDRFKSEGRGRGIGYPGSNR